MTEQEIRREERDRQLQDNPLFRAADEAYRRLEKHGCDIERLKGYIAHSGVYNRGRLRRHLIDPDSRSQARRLRGIQNLLKKAVRQTQALRSSPGLRGPMASAKCYKIPEELEAIAERLSGVVVKRSGEWNPFRDAILDALVLVKESTGRYHYAEVSTLINAYQVRRALTRGLPIPEHSYEVDALKMLVQRHKKLMREKAANQQKTDVLISNQHSSKMDTLPSQTTDAAQPAADSFLAL